jgi:Tfp pilus assembly PilM family ATPase
MDGVSGVLLKEQTTIVGLDIGSSAIKLVELKEKKAGSYPARQRSAWSRSLPKRSSTAPSWTRRMVVETIQRLNSAR